MSRPEPETRTFTITANPVVLRRIERFLALLHYNSAFGHSGLFAMSLDGDGDEKVKVKPLDPKLGREVDLLGNVGYPVEIAYDNAYSGKHIDRDHIARFVTKPGETAAELRRDDEIIKTLPYRNRAEDSE